MRLTDLLALSHVPRWSIVDHLKPQTVSDHVFRVMVIATELSHRLELPGGVEVTTLKYILVHDASECRTGDIPTPAKKHLAEINEVIYCPWVAREPDGLRFDQALLFSLSDAIEATTFIQRYGVGSHARRVAMDMCRVVDGRCPDIKWRTEVRKLMQEINEDAER